MEKNNPVPNNTILVSVDVTSLYTNIPDVDGILACKEVWEQQSIQIPSK